MERTLTPALVARIVDYGEADRICTLLTRERGKVSALARHARRSRRRYGGALSLFVVGQATLVSRGQHSELLTLEGFECLEDLALRIAGDVVKVGHGSYILEAARELWPLDAPDPRCFELVCAALRVLAAQPASASLLRAYELQLLEVVGLCPAFDRCVNCTRPVPTAAPAPYVFNPSRGGILCSACQPQGWPIDASVLQSLQALRELPLDRVHAHVPDPRTARALRDLMLLALRHQLGKDLRSLQFLEGLAQARGGTAQGAARGEEGVDSRRLAGDKCGALAPTGASLAPAEGRPTTPGHDAGAASGQPLGLRDAQMAEKVSGGTR